jgi:hypothetical protein
MNVVVVAAIALVAALAGCTSTGSRSPVASTPVASSPPSARMTECTGRGGEAVLRAFFDDLSHGGSDLLTPYFAPAQDFVRWWDPTRGSGEVVPYTGLQEHLRKLQRDGADAAVIGFTDTGFQGKGTSEAGGWLQFNIRGRLSKDAAVMVGVGKGAIDCRTGKLKALVVDTW